MNGSKQINAIASRASVFHFHFHSPHVNPNTNTNTKFTPVVLAPRPPALRRLQRPIDFSVADSRFAGRPSTEHHSTSESGKARNSLQLPAQQLHFHPQPAVHPTDSFAYVTSLRPPREPHTSLTMSEVDARPPPTRGRSAYRGGRGGIGRGGPRGGRKPVNGTTAEALQLEESFDDQGELGEMKKQYSSQIVQLKDVFPDWTTDDLAFALQESDGDVTATVEKISLGSVSQFSEVKSAKDRARSKVKESSTTGPGDKSGPRGGRGRGGADSVRGGRGRGSDRGRGGFRGSRGGHATTNGAVKDAASTSVPTTESSAWAESTTATTTGSSWDTAAQETTKDAGSTGQSAWADVVTSEATPAAASEGVKSTLIPEGKAKMTWASVAKPAPAIKKASAPQPLPVELVASGHLTHTEPAKEAELPPVVTVIQEAPVEPVGLPTNEAPPEKPPSVTEGETMDILPSKVPLTEENVEHLPDESRPPATQTAASTAGSNDPRNLTPLPGQPAPISRPPMGGYATSAYRATGGAGRSASFQRRVQEQQEAVVMPGHNAVDRAAVQFGSMGLNGEPGPDVDEDREEPETRQAPQHSPPSQPKTSLPPAPRHTTASQEPILPESLSTPKQAPGLPPASVENKQMQDTLPPGIPSEPNQMSQSYAQYGRYGQPGMQQDSGAQQKQYDPFSHQGHPNQFDQYASHNQQIPPQQQSQSGFGGLSSAPNDYSQYYTADQRSGYNNYYGNTYGPQDVRSQLAPGQVTAELGQQRSGSGFGAGPNDTAFSSQMQQQVSTQPPPLLQLNAALNDCNNDTERKFILNEIQRVISNTEPRIMSKPRSPFYKQAIAHDVVPGREQTRDSPFQGPSECPQQSLIDVTNLDPSKTPSLHHSITNISNLYAKQAPSRFADTSGSGHNTPNPIMAGQQQTAPNTHQAQHSIHQSGHHQQGGYGGGSYHPYYSNPYQGGYNNQYAYGNQLGGYGGGGGGYPSKHGGMYGGPHGYGVGPQSSYDQHSASPANTGAFGQNQQTSMRSTSGMSAGLGNLDDYGRSSAQSGGHQQSGGFGSVNENFPRSTSGFGGPSSYGQQSMAQQEDSLKPFADSKGGPSPALGQPGGRPVSAANSAGGTAQSSLPPPQSHQSSFGAYGSFPGQGGYGGLGGLGNQQQQGQNTMGGQGGYGSYGSGGFSQYSNYGSRGGSGWGSNYH